MSRKVIISISVLMVLLAIIATTICLENRGRENTIFIPDYVAIAEREAPPDNVLTPGTGEEVKSEQEAIEIAKLHVWKKYSYTFPDHVIKVQSEGDAWLVLYIPDMSNHQQLKGGGGPAVYIRKATGEVFRCYLQQ